MLTPSQSLLVLAVAYIAQPGPYAGYGWQVEEQLTARDDAVAALNSADSEIGRRRADIARIGAETRLAALLDVRPQPRPLPSIGRNWFNVV